MLSFGSPPSWALGGPASARRETGGTTSDPAMQLLAFGLWLEILMALFEGPIRYLLNAVHLDSVIFVRDAVLFGALFFFIASRAPTRTIPAAVGIFAILMAIHGTISYLNTRSYIPAVYGLKMFLPALCGFLSARTIFKPDARAVRWLVLIWVAAALGAAFDRYLVGNYPWVGIGVELGGVNVSLARDWQSALIKRVGGLSRSSINLAICFPLISFTLLAATRQWIVRVGILAVTLVILVWTTQKGAILGFTLAMIVMLVSTSRLTTPLKIGVCLAMFITVVAPCTLIHLPTFRDSGTFSLQSFLERIQINWPLSWKWIGHFSPITGIGLGGIGGAQRFFAPDDTIAPDNLFLYLFGSFGVASFVYIGSLLYLASNAVVQDYKVDAAALGSLVYLIAYGLVITLIEDQIASIWLGAILGWLYKMQPEHGGARLLHRNL